MLAANICLFRRARALSIRNSYKVVPSQLILRNLSANKDDSKGLLSLQSNIATPEFKGRWLMALPAFAAHCCIGN